MAYERLVWLRTLDTVGKYIGPIAKWRRSNVICQHYYLQYANISPVNDYFGLHPLYSARATWFYLYGGTFTKVHKPWNLQKCKYFRRSKFAKHFSLMADVCSNFFQERWFIFRISWISVGLITVKNKSLTCYESTYGALRIVNIKNLFLPI